MGDSADKALPSPGIGESGVQVWDTEADAPAYVREEDYKAALASGRYRASDQSVVRQNVLGATTTAAPGERVGGFVSGAQEGEQDYEEARKKTFDTTPDKILTFGEGAIDAYTLGLVHDHGDMAELRRQVNSGSAFLGELAGTAGGLIAGGPVKLVAGAGEALGARVAEALVKSPLLTRGITEAGVGAALSGAANIGHQVSDAVIEDKPFAAESLLHDLKLGTFLGFGAGAASALASGVVTKAEIQAQGGLIGGDPAAMNTVTGHLSDAVKAADDAVESHASRHGIASRLVDEYPDVTSILANQELAKQAEAISNARFWRGKVGDVAEGFSGDDADAYHEWRGNVEKYLGAQRDLDEAMRSGQFVSQRIAPSRTYMGPAPGAVRPMSPEEQLFGENGIPVQNLAVNSAMAEYGNAFAYYKTYGRHWQPLPEGEPIPAEFPQDGSPLPGGTETPTSELDTNVGSAKGRAAKPSPLEGRAADRARMGLPPDPLAPLAFEGSGGGVPEMMRGGAPELGPRAGLADRGMVGGNSNGFDTEIPAENFPGGVGPNPSLGARRGNRMSPDTQMLRAGDRIMPKAAADNLLHGEPGGAELTRLPDGHMLPTRSADAVGENFAAFKEKMAGDTMAERAARADRLEKFRASNAPAPEGEQYGPVQRGGNRKLRREGIQGLNDAVGLDERGMMPNQYGPAEWDEVGRKGHLQAAKPASYVRQWLDKYYEANRQYGPTVSPGDIAANRISGIMDDLYKATGGRVDAVGGLGLADKYGFSRPTTALGERMDQVWLLRKAAESATAGTAGSGASLAAKATKKATKVMLAGVLGHKVGGIAGELVAMQAAGYTTAVGHTAAAAGRLATKIEEVGAKVLRPTVTRSAVQASVAANRPVAYSEAGPIKDPVQRILELKRVAAAPDMIRAKIRASLGDTAVTMPQVAAHLENQGVSQVIALSLKAPAIYFDKLGKPYPPSTGDTRKFLETENAVHDLEGALDAIGNGTATRAQADAVRNFYPAAAQKLAETILSDPDTLTKASPERIAQTQQFLGIALSRGADPGYQVRSMQAWKVPAPGAGQQGSGPGMKPQALKIHSETQPTPAASTGPNGK